jgi:hypothetical protein
MHEADEQIDNVRMTIARRSWLYGGTRLNQHRNRIGDLKHNKISNGGAGIRQQTDEVYGECIRDKLRNFGGSLGDVKFRASLAIRRREHRAR